MMRSRLLPLALLASGMVVSPALADESGLSFWLPGQQGSFAAAPGTPGWSWTTVYFHTSVDAGADQAFPRGGKGRVSFGLDGRGDLVLFGPSYTFTTPLLGAQLSLGLLTWGGRNSASVDVTLTGPRGRTINGTKSEDFTGFGDLIPQATLKWNYGVNNFMTYVVGDIPSGAYDPDRLANMGIGHGAIDWGGGYTYFNPATGTEASIVAGLTYNFTNPDTDYRSGIDGHIDWGISQFLNEHFFIGAAGYYFQQLTGDSGDGATLGDFKSRVAGIGPQMGYLFPVSDTMQGAFSAKAYWEFAAENRPEGWNMWVGFVLSPKAPKKE